MEAGMTSSAFLTLVGELVTSVISWMGDVWSFITANPVLAIFVLALPLVGLAISFLNRLFRVN